MPSGHSTVHKFQDSFRRTREDHSSETAEDYVELIEHLIGQHGEARLVTMAEHLGVSPVTVTQTIRRLQREGLVRKEPYRSVFLTDEGRDLAERGRRRHEIVVRFLCAIGVPERQARIDSEGIEHHVSEVTLGKMAEYMEPSACSGEALGD